MLFQEPTRTEYDLNFTCLGVPVRVHPMFWLVGLLLGVRGNTSQGILIWIAALFVSILIHEMGHALTIRYFGWSPQVVLHSFGGLAIYNRGVRPAQSGGRGSRRDLGSMQVLISLAGPGAQLLLAGLVMMALAVTGHPLVSIANNMDPRLFLAEVETAYEMFGRYWGIRNSGAVLEPLQTLVWDLLQINIFWAAFNLLPIYPLDGGQISRELFLARSNDGVRQALTLSFVTAAVVAAFALLKLQQPFLALMLGYMAYLNYNQLNGPFGGFGGVGRRPW